MASDSVPYERLFTTSPNWYRTQAADWSLMGVYAFGGLNTVFLFHVESRRFLGTLDGHTDKVSAVAFAKHESLANICVTAAADCSVRVWDINSTKCVAAHNDHSAEVFAVTTSPIIPNLIVSGDKEGKIVIWQLVGGQRRSLKPVDDAVHAIQLCPFPGREDLVAIGYQNGMLVLLNVNAGSVTVKLVGHVDQIQSLAWCPLPDNSKPATPSSKLPQHVLASGARDKTIRLWNIDAPAGKPNLIRQLHLPKPQNAPAEQQKARIWITLAWMPHDRSQLLSTGFGGDILLWNLGGDSGSSKKPNQFKRLAAAHNRPVFSLTVQPLPPLATLPPPTGAYDYDSSSSTEATTADVSSTSSYWTPLMISTSMDRQIILWNLTSLKPLCRIPSLGGFVYAVDTSDLEPGKVALAVGDKTIRVWNLANPRNPYDAVLFWRGLQSMVTMVTWHPTELGVLAFGTDDGRLGLYDTFTSKMTPFPGHHRGTVYELGWRPIGSDGTVRLYSCAGDGLILETLLEELTSTDVNEFIRSAAVTMETAAESATSSQHAKSARKPPKRSEFAWTNDGKLFAVGNANGSLEIYSDSFILLATAHEHSKIINRLRWTGSIGEDYSEMGSVPNLSRYYLASGSDDGNVVVFRAVLHADNMSQDVHTPYHAATSLKLERLHVLYGHLQPITSLAWDTFVPSRLASGSFDGTCQIWNAATGEPIANLRGHRGRVFAVGWSRHEADIIITGSDDQTACVWRIAAIPQHTFPPTEKRLRYAGVDITAKMEIAAETVTAEPAQPPVSAKKKKKKKKSGATNGEPLSLTAATLLASTYNTGETRDQTYSSISQILDALYREKSRVSPSVETRLFLAGTGDAEQRVGIINPLLQHEEQAHLAAQRIEPYAALRLWQGDVAEMLQIVVKEGKLNDMWLALAPLAGKDVWMSLTRMYAQQLEAKGDTHAAVLHYLAVHSIADAIEAYRRAELYADAVALAAARLPPEDPIFGELYTAWGEHLEAKGFWEFAVKCYLAANMPVRAVKTLEHRADLVALRLAHRIASATPETAAMLSRLSLQIGKQLVRRNEWDEAIRYLAQLPDANERIAEALSVKVWIATVSYPPLAVVGSAPIHPALLNTTSDKLAAATPKWLEYISLVLEELARAGVTLDASMASQICDCWKHDMYTADHSDIHLAVGSLMGRAALLAVAGRIYDALVQLLETAHQCYMKGAYTETAQLLQFVFPQGIASVNTLATAWSVPHNSPVVRALQQFIVMLELYEAWWISKAPTEEQLSVAQRVLIAEAPNESTDASLPLPDRSEIAVLLYVVSPTEANLALLDPSLQHRLQKSNVIRLAK